MAKSEEAKTKKEEAAVEEPKVTIFGRDSERDWGFSRRRYNAGSAVWGVLFLYAGLILLANALNIIPWDFWNHILQFWPVLIVFLGIHIILGNNIVTRVVLFVLAIVTFGLITIWGLKQVSSPLLDRIPANLVNFVDWLEAQKQ